jgi:NAD(P)-dependent dehydrogenase (short-subunit alcohol dehydrogenase family)
VTGALDGLRALVVGGGSGIGLASARLLAMDGASVTIAGRTGGKLADAAAGLAAEGLEVHRVTCDALSGPSVRDAVRQASGDGCLDIAVVVPGGGSIKPVLLFGDDEFSQEVDLNVRPVYLTLKYAGRSMVRKGGGSFVAISSTAADFSTRYLSSYSAGKAAVDQLTRVAADELGAFGVRVNAIRPGLTRTAATQGIFEHPPMFEAFLAGQALSRPGEALDVAQAVRFLAGPESGWITGQHLTVDGGHTLRAFVDYAQFVEIPDVRAAILAEQAEPTSVGTDQAPERRVVDVGDQAR